MSQQGYDPDDQISRNDLEDDDVTLQSHGGVDDGGVPTGAADADADAAAAGADVEH